MTAGRIGLSQRGATLLVIRFRFAFFVNMSPGNQTQVLVLVQQVLYLVRQLPRPKGRHFSHCLIIRVSVVRSHGLRL